MIWLFGKFYYAKKTTSLPQKNEKLGQIDEWDNKDLSTVFCYGKKIYADVRISITVYQYFSFFIYDIYKTKCFDKMKLPSPLYYHLKNFSIWDLIPRCHLTSQVLPSWTWVVCLGIFNALRIIWLFLWFRLKVSHKEYVKLISIQKQLCTE